MPRIAGHYEWDDGDLTPGKKKEGGLHQNLFDEEGNLKGNARFIPGEERDAEPVYVYIHDEDDDWSREEQESAELLTAVVNALVEVAIARGTPHAKRFWAEKLRPALESRRERIADRWAARRKRRENSAPEDVSQAIADPSPEIVAASESFRANMTNSEAQARYLLALAARQFSDEQMRMLANANIRADERVLELGHALAELPPDRVAEVIALLESHPSLLGADLVPERAEVIDGRLIEQSPTEPDEKSREQ